MQDPWNTTKRPNLQIMSTEDIENIFNKVIAENYTNLEKAMILQVQGL
jgi:hypothetical protein